MIVMIIFVSSHLNNIKRSIQIDTKSINYLYLSITLLITFFFYGLLNPLSAHHLTITLSHHHAKPGASIKTYLLSKKPLNKAYVLYNKKRIPLFKHPKGFRDGKHWYFAHIGISRKAKKQKTHLTYVSIDALGVQSRVKRNLFIQENTFDKEYIKLSAKQQRTRNNLQALIKENYEIASILKQNPKPLNQFFRSFTWPLKGRISSTFGKFRIYNGKPSWYHSGMDIAAPTGTPIKSPSSGIVKLAKNYSVHGKTLIIDHGFGIMSIFNHLHTIDVKENQILTQGQAVGTVGSTGLSTGPHLHWGLSIHNTKVDPMLWLKKRFLYL